MIGGDIKRPFLLFAFVMLLASPAFCATEAENKQILRDAIVGAITGAVSAEGSKDGSSVTVDGAVSKAMDSDSGESEGHDHAKHKRHHKDKKKNFKPKKRPHGWDMGKKTGWDGKDVPPGLAKKMTTESQKEEVSL